MNKLTRMRWKLEGTKYVSINSYLGKGGVLLKVLIDAPTTTINVMEVHEGYMNGIESKVCTSVTKCKAEAKKMLQSNGVVFYEEVRKGKTEVCALPTKVEVV
jgi:hypothetical protein